MAGSAGPAGPATDGAEMPSWVPRAILLLLVGVGGLFVAYRAFIWLRALLLLLLIAFFVSLALEPAVEWLARRGWRRGLATFVVALAVTILVGAFSFSMGRLLVEQGRDVISATPDYMERALDWAGARVGFDTSGVDLRGALAPDAGMIQSLLSEAAESAISVAGSVAGLVFNLFTIALFAFYLTADGPRFRRFVCRLLPARRQREVLRAWDIAIVSTGGYIYSRTLLAAASAAFHVVVFTLVGVPNAFALAVWVGVVSQFVPTVGTYIAGAVPFVVALASNPLDALWVVAAIVGYQQVENYLLSPPLTARTMSLHPAVAFGSVIAGAAVLGPVGALLALPAAASVKAFASTYVQQHEVVEDPLTRLDDTDGGSEGGVGGRGGGVAERGGDGTDHGGRQDRRAPQPRPGPVTTPDERSR